MEIGYPILIQIIIILIIIIFSILSIKHKDKLGIGNFIILGITLVVLIFYAYDTHRMANFQSKMYFSPRVIPNIDSKIIDDSTAIKVIYIFQNLTDFYVDAYTTIDLKCFNDKIKYKDDILNRKKKKRIPPLSIRTIRFNIDNIKLKEIGRTVKGLYKIKSDTALIMHTQLEFENEYGESSIVESTYNYNFETNGWDEYSIE